MSKPDIQSLHEFAWEIVLDHAQDIERMSVGEIMADNSMFDEVTEAEFDEVQAIVYDQARAYAKALTKPDEQPQDGPCPRCKYGTDQHRATCERAKDEQPQDERDGDSMRPEDVPDDLVQVAAAAIHAFYAAHPANESEDDAIRVLLAAALDARDAKGGEGR